jgi:hypothetical protein
MGAMEKPLGVFTEQRPEAGFVKRETGVAYAILLCHAGGDDSFMRARESPPRRDARQERGRSPACLSGRPSGRRLLA